jgi:2-keto-4-pentenoate hydratase/2-oxohepta-3-ene-1,7-dioic acid hydratase in catechol pathway
MKYCRFRQGAAHRHGRVEDGLVFPLPQPPWEPARSDAGAAPAVALRLNELDLTVPSEASKVVAVGLNYRNHAAEMGKELPQEPLIFLKPSSSLNGHGHAILLPSDSTEVHYEAELAVVIGQRLHRASEAEASRGIFGLTCFNDVTARDIQRREVQFTRAKSYDTFSCVGPWVETELSPADLRVLCRVNGQVRQDSRTSDMIFSVARVLSFISKIMTLLPGDVVTTGTPAGVGPLRAGDQVEVEIEGIGTLSNSVERAS